MDFQKILEAADAAGRAAAIAVVPEPVPDGDGIVFTPGEGIHGLAWITFADNTAWGHWAKAHGHATKALPEGLIIQVSQYGRSYERKVAYAVRFVEVLTANGIEAYSNGKLD